MMFLVRLFKCSLLFSACSDIIVPASSFSAHGTSSSPSKIRNTYLHQTLDDECLFPQTDPDFDPETKSLSGVAYALVQKGIDNLYPPTELSSRNAMSRTDGYWKFVEKGAKPPLEFTYGEFDLFFFGKLLDRAWEYYGETTHDKTAWENKTFCDIGSGTGRLVLSAAALHPQWRVCKGLEILQGIHNVSVSIAEGCIVASEREDGNIKSVLSIPSDEDETTFLDLAPMQMIHGSFTDPYQYLGDVDCAFVFSSCMNPALLEELSIAIGRQCRPGTIIITTEFPLFLRGHIDAMQVDPSMPFGDHEIELLDKIDGWCWLMGGESTAYIHRVKRSLSEDYGGPREVPYLGLKEEAFQLVQLMENGELTDTKEFMRNVRNNMIFNGLPPEFLPEVDDDESNE